MVWDVKVYHDPKVASGGLHQPSLADLSNFHRSALMISVSSDLLAVYIGVAASLPKHGNCRWPHLCMVYIGLWFTLVYGLRFTSLTMTTPMS